MTVRVLLKIHLSLFACGLTVAAGAPGDFEKNARPFLQEYCVSCHGPEKQKGDLRLDTLKTDFQDAATAREWAEVIKTVNNHEMPPEKAKQPPAESAGKFADWLTTELGRAEIARRSSSTVMRRMNRSEYNNTIRDLVGVDIQPAERFPEDPPAGGFDNIGEALTVSPLHLELYYAAARQILDRALFDGSQPPVLKWHFEPEEHADGSDGARVKRDGQTITLTDGVNETQNGFAVVHHASWNTSVGFKNFKLSKEGEYIIRFRAAGRVPTRDQVVESAKVVLGIRRDQEIAKGSSRKYQEEQFERDLQEFKTARAFDYGSPRLKLTTNIGGVPKTVAEMDVEATEAEPKVYETRAFFTPQKSSVFIDYAYNVPAVVNRDWLVKKEFATPLMLIDWIEIEGPIHASWPPASHVKLLGSAAMPATPAEEKARAKEVISRIMPRAFRRPVTFEEINARVEMFEKARAQKPNFVEAIKVPLAAILTSPNFLFLAEPQAVENKPRKLTPFEYATRLSYFLWSSMPDDELLRVASTGELATPAGRARQINRMIADPRSSAFVTNFAGQWLGLRKVGGNPPVKSKFPEYDRHLEVSMVRESEAFFAEILKHDLDARNLIKSDFVTVNERMARFYGIPGVKGDEFRRVAVPPELHRGGVVTQAAIHTITSNGTRTLPVSRGVWVLKTLLGTDPGLPVDNVGEIASKVPGIDKATVRQRLQIHREDASCARCHDKIDPLGFALENYDASGAWREKEVQSWNGRPERSDPAIDASAKMPDGSEFKGVEGLQAQLLKQDDQFFNGLATKMYSYALGRELGFSDRAQVAASVAELKRNKYTLRSLVQSIAASEPFSSK